MNFVRLKNQEKIIPDYYNVITQTPSYIRPHPGVYVAFVTLLTYPVSSLTAERSFSSTERLKTPLRSTMSDERLNYLAVLHIHKHKDVVIDGVIAEVTRLKGRRLALCSFFFCSFVIL